MEIEEIKKRIDEIKERRDDSENAHAMEDTLWEDVLIAISEGVDNSKELAKECLKTSEIKFDRWFA